MQDCINDKSSSTHSMNQGGPQIFVLSNKPPLLYFIMLSHKEEYKI